MIHEWQAPGPHELGDGRWSFEVWAPLARRVDVHVRAPRDRIVALTPGERGYHRGVIEDLPPGSRYVYRLDGGKERPDPASRFQPEGPHGPSELCSTQFPWHDQNWFGLPLGDCVFYEIHVGTFTPEGTFDAIIPHLDELKDLGITALNIMPVAQFPGPRNWGYDGVNLYAVQNSYGGPQGLKRLVNACHERGLAVVLDVVYNHLGPEGNYLWDFGPYFSDRYKTPWGPAVNFDGPDSDEVRRFFVGNALYWQTEFHMDGLRLDAVHGIRDFSAVPFLQELAQVARRQADRLNRRFHLISESALNDTRVLRSPELGGWGHDAQWSDDFHHAVHTLLTGERNGYYQDFGDLEHMVRAWRDGFTYAGHYSAFRRRRHGNDARSIPAEKFIVCSQNHDQVGNRMLGERLTALVDHDGLKLAAAAVLLSPYLPLLFMGEEYGETAPFQYFISHGDPGLIEAVRTGRKQEFESFAWQGEPPDPQDERTFLRAKLNHELKSRPRHRELLDWYRELLNLRRRVPALAHHDKERQDVVGLAGPKVLLVHRGCGPGQAVLILAFSKQAEHATLPVHAGIWEKVLGEGGPARIESTGEIPLDLHPRSVLVYVRAAGR